jgi:hypothetical protein
MCTNNSILLLVVILLITLVVLRYWRSWRDLDSLIQDLDGKHTGMFTGTFPYEGQTFTLHYNPGSRGSPSELEVYGEGDFFAHMEIRRKEWGGYLVQDTGLGRRIQLNDPSFNELYFECDEPAFVDEFMNAPEVGATVKEILQTFTSIEIDGRRCSVSKTPCHNLSDFDRSNIQNAAHQILLFMQRIPRPVGGNSSATPLTDNILKFSNIFVPVSFILLFGGVFISSMVLNFAFEPVSKSETFWSSLWVGLLAATVFAIYVLHRLKGYMASLRAFFVFVLAGGVGLILLVWGGTVYLNGELDTSLACPHDVVVINKSVTEIKSGYAYNITVSSWKRDLPSYEFTVPYTVYNQLKPFDHCVITTKSGFFGFEWVVSRNCDVVQ